MKLLLTFLPLFAATLTAGAQTVKPLIDTQNYVFIAQSAQPLAGSERRLTINVYSLKITKDSVVSNLPYFGHMTVASTEAISNALDFTSTRFSYTLTPGRKGGWKVSIKPKDAAYLNQLKLTIGEDGFAVVQATFNGLDNISFTGMVADASVLAAR
jgi:hypothetical protein